MKRTMIVLMVMATAATVFSGNASADAGKRRVYEGTVGVGDQPIKLTLVLHQGKAPGLEDVEFGADMACDDGTTQLWFVGLGWGGKLPSLPSHALDLDILDASSVLHLHGKVQAVHGEGTFEFTIPALTADEQAQLCTTGELPWSATRTVPPVEGPLPTPSPTPSPPQVLRFVTAGGVRVTMTRMR